MFVLRIFNVVSLFLLTEGSRRCSHKKQDLFIVLDASRNVGIEEFDQARAFLQGFVSRLDVGLGKTHVGLLLADRKQRTKIQISLGQYDSTDTLSRAIGQIKRSGIRKSNMAYALELVQKKVFTNKDGDREKVNDVLVIFTSRIHPTQLEDVLKRAHKLKKRKVEIITVYFKHTKMTWNVKDELTAIASIPENVLTLRPQKKLKKTLKRRICPSVRAMHPTKGCVRQRRDVFFLLDGSGSITQSYFEKMKKFLVKLVEQLDVGPQGTHVGLLQFSHSLKTKIEFGFGEHKTFEEVKNAILQMRYQEGGTDTGNALEIVNKKVFPENVLYRPNISDVLVILTDGEARDRTKALVEAEKLRRKGVHIMAIGMGEQKTVATFRKDLKLMASSPADVYTADFKKLPYLVKALTSEICYGKPQKALICAHQKRDIVLIVDGSASVGYRNLKKVKRFLQKLMSELRVGKRKNHVALVQFSQEDVTRVEFGFDRYYETKRASRAINKMPYYAGKMTMTGYALSLANDKVFTGYNGDRRQASDVVILVTDGGAHDSKEALENAAKLKQRGVHIVTVYIPDPKNEKEHKEFLQKIASSPGDLYESNFNELKYIAADLVKVVCSSQ